MIRHSIALTLLFLLALAGAGAAAADVSLLGTFDTKAAILSIDAGAPKTVKVGQSFGGVTLIAVEKDRATIEVEGKRRVLLRGQTWSSGSVGADRQSATLAAGAGGHFAVDGAINGGAVRFLVDTGATVIALPARDAARLGLDYRGGAVGIAQTAAGPTPAYRVRFDTVRVGGIELNNVEGVVIEKGLGVALLGMSFLNRVEMRREGDRMTLIRRY
ncbi:MAG: TIGR02281 family clan AA aspartic protease [Betaproteobacteria bacterium]|nr:TIGR02281 family clan AA aspartic protease [Betaproteobacteria bacterium]